MRSRPFFPRLILVIVLLIPFVGMAQTTEFTYQGKLIDGALPANANYDFEFRLFATVSGGSAIATQTRLGVPVANGIFTAPLDFGGQFDGSARWLEIAVKPAGSPNSLTVLSPRQPLTSTPHSIRSLSSAKADVATNSLQLGGVNASQYILTTDSRLTDARIPLPNSANYVQNTTAPQSSGNFNISGDGTAGGTLSASAVNAATQYNLGGNRILSNAGTFNLFAGSGAGVANTSGQSNSFFGRNAGVGNTAGSSNSFFGDSAGFANNTGDQNSFFGFFGGLSNMSGVRNSYFGYRAGQQGTANNDNSFFGYRAGFANTANGNSFFGVSAGESNTDFTGNSYFGYHAGQLNNAAFNSFFGYRAGSATTAGYDNAFFGSSAGADNTTGFTNSFFGENSGSHNTSGMGNNFFGSGAGQFNTSGNSNAFFGVLAGTSNTTGDHNSAVGNGANVNAGDLSFATAIGAGAKVLASNTIALGRSDGSDRVVVYGLGAAGSTDVCRNGSNQLSTCSSSLRYKTDVESFFGGIGIVRRLRPIVFNWKDGGRHDVGFGAEEVEKVEPLLVTYNAKGEIEGVKYGQLTAVLVNAVKEQQAQLEAQQEQIAEQQKLLHRQQQQNQVQQKLLQEQQRRLDALQKLVCLSYPKGKGCNLRQRSLR